MPCTSPIITTASMLTDLQGRSSTHPFIPGRHRRRLGFCVRLPLAMTSLQTSCNYHKFRHVICNASFPGKNGSSTGKFGEELEYEQVVDIIASSVIGAISSKLFWQVVEDLKNGNREKFVKELYQELDQLIDIGKTVNESQEPSLPDNVKGIAEKYLGGKEHVRNAWMNLKKEGEDDYLHGLAVVDILIDQEQYELAKEICEELDELKPSDMDSRVALRMFIVSLGRTKELLDQCINKNESVQDLIKQHNGLNDLITNFEKSIRRVKKFKGEYDDVVGSFQDMDEAKKMLRFAEEQLITYIEIERERFVAVEVEKISGKISDDVEEVEKIQGKISDDAEEEE